MKNPHPSRFVTFLIVAGSSVLFCSKGVFAKLAYAEGVDALTVLALRTAFAFPFFVLLAVLPSPGARQPLAARDWGRLALLGFVGYYLSSLVNFTGLQYISVGLERIILYTYPSIVLGLSAVVMRRKIPGSVWTACAVAWVGIVIAFAGETHRPVAEGRTAFGAALILASALTYAIFITVSGDTVKRVGTFRFTGIVVGFSCLMMQLHYAATRPLDALFQLPVQVYGYGVILAIFGTVAPALLLSLGLKRAGAQSFAIISTIGPVTTLFLAWALLGEHPNLAQGIGFVLTLTGGLAVSLLKSPKPA
jgi:drug/metabolite transporter (DMT)-like permease